MEQQLSGRLLALVLMLAVCSAAVGAGAAFLLRSGDDDPQPAHEVTVVATVQSTEQEAEPPEVEQPAQARSQQEATVAPRPDEPAKQEETAEEPEPAAEQAEEAEVAEPPQQEAHQQSSDEVAQENEQPVVAEPEPQDVATISPDVIVQGEVFSVLLESLDASAAAATVGGRSWDLSSTSEGSWWAVIAVPRDAAIGVTEVLIDLYAEGGVWMRAINLSIIVLASTAPFEEIELGGTGTPADPAAVARDIAVRFTEHIAVTGPPRWQGTWILPVEGEVTGVFGAERSYDGVVAQGWHHGHDIAAQHGDPIVAPAHGTVVWTGDVVLHGMGVIIDHGAGVYSGYWHMSLIAVRAGHEVAPGDWLGNIGTTGLSTGPHLHWEVIVQGIDVDPVQWLGEERPPLPSGIEEVGQSTDTLQ